MARSKRALAALLGRREVSALLYRRDAFPEGLLGPAQLLLDPWTSTRSYGEIRGKEDGQDCEHRQEEVEQDDAADFLAPLITNTWILQSIHKAKNYIALKLLSMGTQLCFVSSVVVLQDIWFEG